MERLRMLVRVALAMEVVLVLFEPLLLMLFELIIWSLVNEEEEDDDDKWLLELFSW